MIDYDYLSKNVADVREKMEQSARLAGSDIRDITLCAASKTQTAETVALARELNIDIFGENRVQELKEKFDAGAYGPKPCHFIGHLQTNKVRQTVGRAGVIQSVDSVRLMEEIGSEAVRKGLIQQIMIEINIGAEQSKSGIDQGQLEQILENAAIQKGVFVCGMMAIPPISEKKGQNRQFFSILCKLFIDMRAKKYDNVNMCYLSMGMSRDFEDAILEGANLIRIGTGIFGKRN